MFCTADGKLGSSGSVSIKLLGLTDEVLFKVRYRNKIYLKINEIYQSLKGSCIYSLYTLCRMRLVLIKITTKKQERFKEDQQKCL